MLSKGEVNMAYKTIYPFTNETLKEYANHTDAELEQAIASGHALYKKWRRENNLEERKAQLHKVADLLRRDADKYAETITKDMGKLIGEAKGEVLLCADIADYYADKADEFLKPQVLETAAGEAYYIKQSIGVIFAVEPWNFPSIRLCVYLHRTSLPAIRCCSSMLPAARVPQLPLKIWYAKPV